VRCVPSAARQYTFIVNRNATVISVANIVYKKHRQKDAHPHKDCKEHKTLGRRLSLLCLNFYEVFFTTDTPEPEVFKLINVSKWLGPC
jgi:hypothetical protein